MNAKEYLDQVRQMEQMLANQMEQIESLNALATKATNVMSQMPGSPNRNIHKMEDTILKIIDLENRFTEELDKLVVLKAEIVDVISKVSKLQYRSLLQMRYLQFMKWEEIAEQMNVSLRYVYRLKDRALDEVGQILKKM